MSQENVEIVRRAFEAFRANDFEALFAIVSPSIAVYPNPDEPGASSRHEGWEGMFDYLVNWYAGWEDYSVEPTQFIEAGDYVVVDARETGIAEQSGIRVEQTFSHAFELRDGQIVEWRQFGPLQQALEAVGLRE
jgi:ketosteroid isomerase-like protein